MAGQARSGIVWDAAAEARFQAALKRGIDGYKLRTEADLARAGLMVQNEARSLCPVDTGRLRSSIQSSGVKRDRLGSYVDIGTNVEYAPFVEFGTRHAAPQPFMRPALLKALEAFR